MHPCAVIISANPHDVTTAVHTFDNIVTERQLPSITKDRKKK